MPELQPGTHNLEVIQFRFTRNTGEGVKVTKTYRYGSQVWKGTGTGAILAEADRAATIAAKDKLATMKGWDEETAYSLYEEELLPF